MRAECLDWLLILGPSHLDRVLRIDVQHYNRRRPHRGLQLIRDLLRRARQIAAVIGLLSATPSATVSDTQTNRTSFTYMSYIERYGPS